MYAGKSIFHLNALNEPKCISQLRTPHFSHNMSYRYSTLNLRTKLCRALPHPGHSSTNHCQEHSLLLALGLTWQEIYFDPTRSTCMACMQYLAMRREMFQANCWYISSSLPPVLYVDFLSFPRQVTEDATPTLRHCVAAVLSSISNMDSIRRISLGATKAHIETTEPST